MDLGLADARVVVTGGGSNIGRGIVHAFAAEGARIVINGIDVPQADKVRAEAEELGAAEVAVVIADLTKPEAAEAVVDAARTAWGGLDVLVNNAGWSVLRGSSRPTPIGTNGSAPSRSTCSPRSPRPKRRYRS